MLCLNSTEAERARECYFAETFESPTHVAKNRGTVVGTVPIGFGAAYPGTNGNYISYVIDVPRARASLSFVFEFWPNFAANDGVAHNLFVTYTPPGAAPTDYVFVRKTATNSLDFTTVAGIMISVALANYQNYWYQNSRNVLVATMITGSEYLYLNGVQIGNGAVAFATPIPSALNMGANTLGNDTFNGKMRLFREFGSILTLAEARDYWFAG